MIQRTACPCHCLTSFCTRSTHSERNKRLCSVYKLSVEVCTTTLLHLFRSYRFSFINFCRYTMRPPKIDSFRSICANSAGKKFFLTWGSSYSVLLRPFPGRLKRSQVGRPNLARLFLFPFVFPVFYNIWWNKRFEILYLKNCLDLKFVKIWNIQIWNLFNSKVCSIFEICVLVFENIDF
jgi:hypothetical protein